MATLAELQAVIAVNRERQELARNLNIRAGKEVFPALSNQQLQEWLVGRLNGAISVSTIANLDLIRLPELDEKTVGRVISENPDTITISGRRFPVTYSQWSLPSITLSWVDVQDKPFVWLSLPDEGVVLPGGTTVKVIADTGLTSISETEIPLLKTKLKEILNTEQWIKWQIKAPALRCPDPSNPQATVPEIVLEQYGNCVIDGSPLYAFGVAAINPHFYFTSDPRFVGKWYKDQKEANAVRAASVAKLAALQEGVRLLQERDKVQAAATLVKESLVGLYRKHYDNRALDYATRERLSNYNFQRLPSGVGELDKWRQEAQAFIVRVESALFQAQRQHERNEMEAAIQQANDSQELKPILSALLNCDVALARQIANFAEAVKETLGDRDAAIRFLKTEVKTPYRDYREQQDSIRRRFPKLDVMDAGRIFFGIVNSREVARYLYGSLAWLESQPAAQVIKKEEKRGQSNGLNLEALKNAWSANMKR